MRNKKSIMKRLSGKYEYVDEFHEGFAAVKGKNGLWGFIDKNLEEVIPCTYDDAGDFKEGLAPVRKGTWGFIDKTGKVVIPFIYDYVSPFENGFALVVRVLDWDKLEWIRIDKKGNEQIVP